MQSFRALTVVLAVITSSLLGCRSEERVAHSAVEVDFALAHLGPVKQTPIFLGAGDRLGRDVYCAYLAQHHLDEMYAAE